MKKTILILAALSMGVATLQAATVRLDNGGSGLLTTGDNLDGISTVPSTVTVVESPGLFLTVHGLAGTGTEPKLNSTTTSFGIDVVGSGDDADAFDSGLGDSVTFSFSKAVSITQLDFTIFDDGDTFEFGSTTITFLNLANTTTDVYDFGSPLLLAANEQFTMSASNGDIGIEALTLTVIPEPSSTALLGLGGLALILRRRK